MVTLVVAKANNYLNVFRHVLKKYETILRLNQSLITSRKTFEGI